MGRVRCCVDNRNSPTRIAMNVAILLALFAALFAETVVNLCTRLPICQIELHSECSDHRLIDLRKIIMKLIPGGMW